MEPQRPWLTSLCHLGWLVNTQLHGGDHGVTFKDVYDGLDGSDLFKRLERKISGFDAFGVYIQAPGTLSAQAEATIAALKEASERFRGDERKEIGVDGGGLSLLAAIVLYAIQEKLWVDAPKGQPGHGFPLAN